MILLRVDAPYASFRKSYARSFAETYPLPPPATVYGMLLSLVGERFRARHQGTRMALAFGGLPKIATTLRKLSRYKYGVPGKQSKLGNAPDFIETLCGIDFLCWLDSSEESALGETLEERVVASIERPSSITRYGVLSLGLSDDAVNDVRLCREPAGEWRRLVPSGEGNLELPVWVDHVGALGTRWQRYALQERAEITLEPGHGSWPWTLITPPTRD
jgi:CRISPR-associated protein Cas5t